MRHFARIVSRFAVVLIMMLSVLAALPMASEAKPSGDGPGNSANAHTCQQGGWQNIVREDGSTFSNQGACVSYAAQGGVLADTRCVGDEFYDWRTTDRGRFASVAECSAYALAGGELVAPVPYATFDVQAIGNGTCTVQGLYQDFVPGSSWYGGELIDGVTYSSFYGGSWAPYGDSNLGPVTLNVGQVYTIYADISSPRLEASYTCTDS